MCENLATKNLAPLKPPKLNPLSPIFYINYNWGGCPPPLDYVILKLFQHLTPFVWFSLGFLSGWFRSWLSAVFRLWLRVGTDLISGWIRFRPDIRLQYPVLVWFPKTLPDFCRILLLKKCISKILKYIVFVQFWIESLAWNRKTLKFLLTTYL